MILGPCPSRPSTAAPAPVTVHWVVGGRWQPYSRGGAVLPLRRAEVGGGHRRRPGAEAPVQRHGRQGQGLPHGGAGPVQPQEGDLEPPGGEGGADALVEQVPGEEQVQGGGVQPRLVQGGGEGLALHGGLRPLPGGLPKGVVPTDGVKGAPQGPLPLLFARHVGVAGDDRGMLQGHRLPPQLFCCHGALSSPVKISVPTVPGRGRNMRRRGEEGDFPPRALHRGAFPVR